MRTSIDIPDPLLREAKVLAGAEKTTLRALIEEGLRHVLSKRQGRKKLHMRDASVPGKGLQPGVQEGSWEEIRTLTYQGRGT